MIKLLFVPASLAVALLTATASPAGNGAMCGKPGGMFGKPGSMTGGMNFSGKPGAMNFAGKPGPMNGGKNFGGKPNGMGSNGKPGGKPTGGKK